MAFAIFEFYTSEEIKTITSYATFYLSFGIKEAVNKIRDKSVKKLKH